MTATKGDGCGHTQKLDAQGKMVRNYISKKYSQSNVNDLLRGIRLIEEGASLRKEAAQTDVPKTTLQRWYQDEDMQPGHLRSGCFHPVLTVEEEELIVTALEQVGKMGWPCGPSEIKTMIKSYLDNLGGVTPFKDNSPGRDWMCSFKERWSHRIRLKRPQLLSKNRAGNLKKETLDAFVNMVRQIYAESGILDDEDAAERIYNCDETGSTRMRLKISYFLRSRQRTLTCTKIGHLVVYKGAHVYEDWTSGCI